MFPSASNAIVMIPPRASVVRYRLPSSSYS